MARGKGKKGGKSGQARTLGPEHFKLNALLLADSFDSFHKPLSLRTPRCLFPVANIPLIEYTFEFLASNGIQKVFVFASAHADMIKNFILQSRWSRMADFSVEVVISHKARTAGDALREMYSKGVLEKDFVLVSGDVVSTIDLKPVIAEHLTRRILQKDKESIVTCVFRQVPPTHPSRPSSEDVLLGVDADDSQILSYVRDSDAKSLQLDTHTLGTWLGGHKKVKLRRDVMDARIAICAPEVLAQFQDNFDYPDVPHFVQGIVNEEILSVKSHCYVVQKPGINGIAPTSQYSSRVTNWRMYRAVTSDIVNRWTYPMVPDRNLLGSYYNGSVSTYRVTRHAIYKEKDVSLAQSSKILGETVIGAGSTIGKNSQISHSVIGRHCMIGRDVVMKNVILWEHVKIDDGAVLTDCVVGEMVHIHANVKVPRGSIIGSSAVLGTGATLEPFAMVVASEDAPSSAEPLGGEGTDACLYGPSGGSTIPGKGTEYVEREEAEEDEESSEDSEMEGADTLIYHSQTDKFRREVYETVMRAEESSNGGTVSSESVKLEVGSLKLVFDFDFLQTVEAVMLALIEIPEDKFAITKTLKRWAKVVNTFLESPNRKNDEKELLYFLQELTETRIATYSDTFTDLLRGLYDSKIISGEQMIEWADEQDVNDEIYRVVDKAGSFLDWLRNNEGGSGSDTDSSGFSDVYSGDDGDQGWFGGGGGMEMEGDFSGDGEEGGGSSVSSSIDDGDDGDGGSWWG